MDVKLMTKINDKKSGLGFLFQPYDTIRDAILMCAPSRHESA